MFGAKGEIMEDLGPFRTEECGRRSFPLKQIVLDGIFIASRKKNSFSERVADSNSIGDDDDVAVSAVKFEAPAKSKGQLDFKFPRRLPRLVKNTRKHLEKCFIRQFLLDFIYEDHSKGLQVCALKKR